MSTFWARFSINRSRWSSRSPADPPSNLWLGISPFIVANWSINSLISPTSKPIWSSIPRRVSLSCLCIWCIVLTKSCDSCRTAARAAPPSGTFARSCQTFQKRLKEPLNPIPEGSLKTEPASLEPAPAGSLKIDSMLVSERSIASQRPNTCCSTLNCESRKRLLWRTIETASAPPPIPPGIPESALLMSTRRRENPGVLALAILWLVTCRAVCWAWRARRPISMPLEVVDVTAITYSLC